MVSHFRKLVDELHTYGAIEVYAYVSPVGDWMARATCGDRSIAVPGFSRLGALHKLLIDVRNDEGFLSDDDKRLLDQITFEDD